MSKTFPSSSHIERKRVLDRKKTIELWKAEIDGLPCIVKCFLSPRATFRNDFLIQSRIMNSAFLRPELTGWTEKGGWFYVIPTAFPPGPLPGDFDIFPFVSEFLALSVALQKRKMIFRWDPDHIVCDPHANRAMLAGFNSICPGSFAELQEQSRRLITQLKEWVSRVESGSAVLKILKKWERRKAPLIGGCLQEMLSESKLSMNRTVTRFEWNWSEELELIGGLYQLAEHGRGGAVLFLCDPGEGKSALLRQVREEFSVRRVILVHRSSGKEERSYHSARKLLDSFLENAGVYRKRMEIPRLILQFVQGSKEIDEESIAACFLRTLECMQQEETRVFLFLIDDLHLYDAVSLRMLGRILQEAGRLPVLFVMTSRKEIPVLGDAVIKVPIHPAPLSQFLKNYFVPFWKREQRRTFLKLIYEATAGNPSLFHHCLEESLHQKKDEFIWRDENWKFIRPRLPELPGVAIEYCMGQLPDLSSEERAFLAMASIQGSEFDPLLVPVEDMTRPCLLSALHQKGVLVTENNHVRFRRPVLAESIYRSIPPSNLQNLHQNLAEELKKRQIPEVNSAISRHLLRGGDFEGSLEFACQSIREDGNAPDLILPLLEEMEPFVSEMDGSAKLRFYRERAVALYQRGHYPAAAESFQQAVRCATGSQLLRFDLLVRTAQCHLLSNDILSAQNILQEQIQSAALIQDEKLLVRYHLARGTCSWYRGISDRSDMEKAISIAEKLEDYESLANCYRQRAELALREGALTEAHSLAQKAHRFADKSRNEEERGHALKILGSIAWRRSRYQAAERLLRKSIRAFSKIKNAYGVAGVWSLLGNVDAERYRFSAAVRSFRKAVHLFSRLNHQLEVSLAQFNLGTVYVEQSRIREAEAIFQRCLSIDKRSGNKRYYAFDLRALAVVSILRGFYRKGRRLLTRTLQIFEELQAEGDVLQTKLILLLNELQQNDIKRAKPLVDSLQPLIPGLHEPRTEAEIRYLSGIYFEAIGEKAKAQKECFRSIYLSRRIGYFKLIAKNLIQKLIMQNAVPSPSNQDFRRMILYFRKSRNKLEEAIQLLRLFQVYPELVRGKENVKNLVRFKRLFRRIGNPVSHRVAQKLTDQIVSKNRNLNPSYEWWHQILQVMGSNQDFNMMISQVLLRLGVEFQARFSSLYYLNQYGVYERLAVPDNRNDPATEELSAKVLDRVLAKRQALLVDLYTDPEFSHTSWVLEHERNSVIAIPVQKEDHVLAVWYFERRRPDISFNENELNKAAFFASASAFALEKAVHHESTARTGTPAAVSNSYEDLIGGSSVMRELFKQMGKLAPVDISVLILGESGTGKELVARSLHRNSRRPSGTFCALNCSALPETLIESELFGYSRGAFTGAASGKPGLIEQAHRGTFFLDEVGDLSPGAQAKLLRVIQEREVQRLGETVSRKIDVRFLFATHKDLKTMVREGTYREDLFYRISTSILTIPPLRERSGDVLLLVNHFMKKYSESFNLENPTLSPSAARALREYSWPGNIRELENVVQGLLIHCETNGMIDVHDLPDYFTGNRQLRSCAGMSLEEAKANFERDFLQRALNLHRWNKTQTARELRITRQGLISMIQRLGLKEPVH